jgi:hypothetical protein
VLVALAMSGMGRQAHAITSASFDGRPTPLTLTVGETVTLRFDVSKPGVGMNYVFSRDSAGSGKYEPSAPVWTSGTYLDASGADIDPAPGKVAVPFAVPPNATAGTYVLHLDDPTDRTSVDLPGVTIVPKPEPQSISGRVAVITAADPSGTPPPDALSWASSDSRTAVANATIRKDGSYTLPVPPGTYLLFAEWLGNLHSQRQRVNLVAGQQRTGVDLPLSQGQEVAGTVRSGDQPAADVVVQAVAANGAMLATKTLADGSYVLVLPGGRHRITASGMTQEIAVADGPVDGVDFPPAAAPPAASPGTIATVVGNGVFGEGGEGRPATTARLVTISGLALDTAGNLYLSSNRSHRIRKVDAQTGIITTIAGSSVFEIIRGLGPSPTGGGYGGDGGPATKALLNTPNHLALDTAGNLYVSEVFNHRVRRIAPDGIITTLVGTGQEGAAGDGGPALAAQLAGPQSIVCWTRRATSILPMGVIGASARWTRTGSSPPWPAAGQRP